MRKSKSISTSNSIFANILKGLITGITTFLVVLAVFSLIILKTDISGSLFYIFVLITVGLSAFFGSFVTAVCAKKSRLIIAMFTALFLLSMSFILLLCFNNASLSVKIYLSAPIAVLFGFIGGVTGSNIRRK